MPEYSISQFESDISGMKPRFFDTWILPGFMLWFAMQSKKGMGKNVRRMLFTAGVYMTFRNFTSYKQAYETVRAKLSTSGESV